MTPASWNRMQHGSPAWGEKTRVIMRAWMWAFVAAMGWGAMLAAFATRVRPDSRSPWGRGAVVVGPELPAELAQTGHATRMRLRNLPAIERTEAILGVLRQVAKDKAADLELGLRPRLLLLPLDKAGIDASSLQSGSMPIPGRDQVIAGASAAHHDRVMADDRELDVVGVLKPEFALVRNDYLVPPSEKTEALFPDGDPSVHPATLVQLTSHDLRDRQVLQKLQKSLPAPKYKLLMPMEWLEPKTYYLYLGGLAAFLLGGSGALIGLFRGLAARARRRSPDGGDDHGNELADPAKSPAPPVWWASPLIEMERRPRLVWGVHLVYFGFVIAGSVLVYNLHDVQAILLSNVADALGASSGPLATAARAYGTGSIIRAAAVTFVINFFLGSLLMITLPSIVVPGSGIFMAATSLRPLGLSPCPQYDGVGICHAAALRDHASGRGRLHPGHALRSVDSNLHLSIKPGRNTAVPLRPRALAQCAG